MCIRDRHRTRGVTLSGNTELPNPLNSYNSPLGSLNNKNKETIQKENRQYPVY